MSQDRCDLICIDAPRAEAIRGRLLGDEVTPRTPRSVRRPSPIPPASGWPRRYGRARSCACAISLGSWGARKT